MLIAPPLELENLLEDVYDKDVNFVKEKLSEQATPEQKKMFEKYQKECEDALRRSFRVDLSDRTYNPVDGWRKK